MKKLSPHMATALAEVRDYADMPTTKYPPFEIDTDAVMDMPTHCVLIKRGNGEESLLSFENFELEEVKVMLDHLRPFLESCMAKE